VSTVTGCELDDQVKFQARVEIFLFAMSRPGLRPIQPHILWVPGVEWPQCEVNCSCLSNVEQLYLTYK